MNEFIMENISFLCLLKKRVLLVPGISLTPLENTSILYVMFNYLNIRMYIGVYVI